MSSNEKQDKDECNTPVTPSTKSSISSYKQYRQKKKKRIELQRKRSKSNTVPHEHESCELRLLFTKEYLLNKFNLLRFAVLIVTFLLLFVCILYGVGSVISLELDDFWCSNQYSWNEIAQYNRENNYSLGVGGCYVAQRRQFDENKVFATDSSESALVPTQVTTVSAIFKMITYTIISIVIVYILIKHISACVVDCRKTVTNEW